MRFQAFVVAIVAALPCVAQSVSLSPGSIDLTPAECSLVCPAPGVPTPVPPAATPKPTATARPVPTAPPASGRCDQALTRQLGFAARTFGLTNVALPQNWTAYYCRDVKEPQAKLTFAVQDLSKLHGATTPTQCMRHRLTISGPSCPMTTNTVMTGGGSTIRCTARAGQKLSPGRYFMAVSDLPGGEECDQSMNAYVQEGR